MHYRVEFVSINVISIGDVLIKVMLPPWLNISPYDANVTIAVFPALLMPKANCVPDFMDCCSESTAGPKGDHLHTPLHAHI